MLAILDFLHGYPLNLNNYIFYFGKACMIRLFSIIIAVILFCCDKPIYGPDFYEIRFLVSKISPGNGGFIPDTGEIRATFEYFVGNKDTSFYGYTIIIELEPLDGNGFEATPSEVFHFNKRCDTIEIHYPLQNVRKFSGLKYPLTCRFWLERQDSAYINGFIANTNEYTFEYNRDTAMAN